MESGDLIDVRAQNPGKTDSEIKEIYVYGAGLHSIRSIVGLSRFKNLQFLSLHNNQIRKIEGLDLLSSLSELNLSSNNISAIQGLTSLSSLRVLNLSCNRIKEIAGLEGLFSLTKLVLSHNQISKLSGISALHGPSSSLKYLDLRDNFVKSLAELWQLAGCSFLEELLFSQGKYTNPVCQENTYKSTLAAALPHLKYLDGEPVLVPDLETLPSPAAVQPVSSPLKHKLKAGRPPKQQMPLQMPQQMPQQMPLHISQQMPHKGTSINTLRDEYDTRLGLLEVRFGELLETIRGEKSSAPVEKVCNEKAKKEEVEPRGDRHQVDHTMKGFCRKRSLQLAPAMTSSICNEDYESRLGVLESRFSEVLDALKRLDHENAEEEVESLMSYSYNNRKENKRWRQLDDRRPAKLDNKLEQLFVEIAQVQIELSCLKDELSKSNALRALQPRNIGSHLQEKRSTPSPGKENFLRLEKELKEKDAELQKMRESTEYIQSILSSKKEKLQKHGSSSTAEQVKSELQSLHSEKQALQSEKKALQDELDAARSLKQKAELALADANAEKANLRKSAGNTSRALEDEQIKLKVCNAELESCKRKEVWAQEEVKRLSNLLATERTERRKEIESLTS